MENTVIYQENMTSDKQLDDYISGFWRRKWMFLSIFTIISILGITMSLVLPSMYKSSAVILIEQQEIPKDLVRSTVTSFADQRVQVISQRVMTSANLKSIIDKYGLYVEERKEEPLELILDKMREDISLDMISADVLDPSTGKPAKATIAFSISYENKSPRSAQKVTNEIVSLFLDENLRNRTEMAQEAHDFLQDEAERLNEMVDELEKKLAEFKEENSDSLPDMVQLNMEFMERQERELSDVKRTIQALQERKIYLQSELGQINPYQGNISETGQRILGPKDRLKSLESEYISLSAKYSEQHPDVVKLKKEIEALELEVGKSQSNHELLLQIKSITSELAQLKKTYSSEHPDVRKLQRTLDNLEEELANKPKSQDLYQSNEKPDNPAYIRLQTELEATTTEINSLKFKVNDINDKIVEYELRLSKSPEVERVYRSLQRDYENALAKFREVKAKQMEAQLARDLESENKSERFTLIEPPVEPPEPYSPNRIALVIMGFALAGVLGLGVVFLFDSMDKGIYGKKAVQQIYGENPLTVVPRIDTRKDLRNRWMRNCIFIVIFFICMITGFAFVHFFVSPLDVLWFVYSRKLGID